MHSVPGKICIVIPTRNRADLAAVAIQSVLCNTEDEFIVVVSDNSTDSEAVKALGDFCEHCADSRLSYVRPELPLAMGVHWEWVLEEVLSKPEVSHVLFLTDRMIFKDGELQHLLSASKLYCSDVISYTMDGIQDIDYPIRLMQTSWTGNLYRLDSSELLSLNARMIIHNCLPRMLNSIVPRKVLEDVKDHYGTYLNAVSPDFAFANRCLERVDSILFLDRPALVNYALNRSNGANAVRGLENKDHKDFLANLDERGYCYAAPVPEFRTVGNAIIHEYCLVKQQSGNHTKLPEVDKEEYYTFLGNEILGLQNDELRLAMQTLLDQQPKLKSSLFLRRYKKIKELIFSWRSLRVKFWWLATSSKFQPVWGLLERVLKVQQPGVRDRTIEFTSLQEALNYADRQSRHRNPGLSYLEVLVHARKMPLN